MNCPICGEVCRCHLEPPHSASLQWTTDAGKTSVLPPVAVSQLAIAGVPGIGQEAAEASVPIDGIRTAEAPATGTAGSVETVAEADAPAWRDELSARLNRYRARRKTRPPRYPSLSLRFDAVETLGSGPAALTEADSAGFEPVSDQALALDEMRQEPVVADANLVHHPSEQQAVRVPSVETRETAATARTAKILEFPRFAWGPPPPPLDQLAEPVTDRPRILEAPEIVPPAPALGGITIEAAAREEMAKRPGIDIPLQSASLARRVGAGAIDGLIVAAAAALFGFVFWKVAAVRPPLLQILGLGAGIPWLFWMVYQYLLIVYAGSTPGLHVAGLELARFDGTSTHRRLRRWRVIAACLSGVSLGMGYVWVFLDEDVLCWHDRITHTYLAPRKRGPADCKSA